MTAPLSYKQLGKILERFGYILRPSKRGHAVYINGEKHISLPRHKEICPGIIKEVCRKLGISVSQLRK